jgi:dTDP-4-amino-4,6-dideoxygalactose transaminase
MITIPFNKPFLTGEETSYIKAAVRSGKISGDGLFTQKCHDFFRRCYGFGGSLLTTSCTDALELAAILCDLQPGDEVIAPSYTFVSTVNPFVLRGAKIVFADSEENTPNIDATNIKRLISPNTKVIVVVHYAGVACDMDPILALAKKHNLRVVEDAAQAIDSFYKGRPLGSIGCMSAFSFHETKNVIAGEGGLFVANDPRLQKRAEIVREKGTNRSAFFRGEVDKYRWVDIGSSFLPSEITAAFLYAQLEQIEQIQTRRKKIWEIYESEFRSLDDRGEVRLPHIPSYATNNAHMFYLVCQNAREQTNFIKHMKNCGFLVVSHYHALHKSPFYLTNNLNMELPNAEKYSECLVRLPLYYELREQSVLQIAQAVKTFYQTSRA